MAREEAEKGEEAMEVEDLEVVVMEAVTAVVARAVAD